MHNQMVRAEKVGSGFCALSKLVFYKTQLLELVESSMEVPHCYCFTFYNKLIFVLWATHEYQ